LSSSTSDYERGASRVRSFRIDTALDEALQMEVESGMNTVSSFLNNILKEYMEFTRITDKMNSITLSEVTLKGFLNYLTPEECEENGLKIGATIPKQMLMLDGRSVSIDSLNVILDRAGDHAGWFKYWYHGDTQKGYIFINNRLGSKWSSFLQGYLTGLVRSLGAEPNIETIGDNLLLRIIECEE
jgi:hypothetical protein